MAAVTAQEAAGAAGASVPPGVFLLCWGLVAAAFGLAMVTNFRGFTDNFVDLMEQRSNWSGRSLRRFSVAAAAIFAIAGPVALIAGVISIGRGQIGLAGTTPVSGPFRYLFIAVTAAIIGWYWLSPVSPFRTAANRSGWRLAIAVTWSLAALAFGICVVIGQAMIGVAVLTAGGLPVLLLLTDSNPRPPGRQDPPQSAGP